jgi:alpha-tubulin suppressor-like RCC1 family protein
VTRIVLVTAALVLAGCVDRGQVLGPGTRVVLQTSAVRLALGQEHACAVGGGALRCWGLDDDGQLGTPPVVAGVGQGASSVAGATSWIVPAAGERHSCGLDASGRVWCWGANDMGQLGTGDQTPSAAPRAVALPQAALDVRTLFDHTCAVLADATLWCWGANLEGQLGQGDQYPGHDQPLPVQVGTNSDWTFVATGQGHGCGIRAAGALFCWGRNTDGELGQGSTRDIELRSPTQIGSDSDWVEVACGQNHTCARKSNGRLFCWGNMASGALAVGDTGEHDSPTEVPAISDWVQASTNTFHICGLRASGQIWCAGRNSEGQLGRPGAADADPNMQQADPNAGWVEVTTGRFFTCGRKGDDSVWCMGKNSSDQLNAGGSVPSSDVMLRAL